MTTPPPDDSPEVETYTCRACEGHGERMVWVSCAWEQWPCDDCDGKGSYEVDEKGRRVSE